jgi:hypothetical protein
MQRGRLRKEGAGTGGKGLIKLKLCMILVLLWRLMWLAG